MADRAQLIQAAVAALQAAADDLTTGLENRQRDTMRRMAQRILRWADPAAAPTTSATSGLLTRSQYARAAGVAMNTLLLWEQAGRLVPAYRNPLNGYRYYSPAQVAQARTLRQRRRN